MSLVPDYATHTTYETLISGAKEVTRTSFYEADRLQKESIAEDDEFGLALSSSGTYYRTAWTDTAYHDRTLEYLIKDTKRYGHGSSGNIGGPGSCYVMPAGYSNDSIAFMLDGQRIDAEIYSTPHAAVVEWYTGHCIHTKGFNIKTGEILIITKK